MLKRRSWLCLAGAGLVGLTIGCGPGGDRPPLGRVRGKVLMDGEPLVGVIISFKPDDGRAATATTEGDGTYDLDYRYRVKGCKIGPNTVSFAWPTGVSGSGPIPEEYASKSTLKRDVKAGSNTFDFELKTNGATKPNPTVVPKSSAVD